MFRELRVAVVIPAFNEELNVARTVASACPRFVDHVLVVDDASRDRTFREASRLRRRGLEVLRHRATAASARRSPPAIGARSSSASTSRW